MTYNVNTLLPDERRTLERLLGHALADDQKLNIRTYSPEPLPDWFLNSPPDSWPDGSTRLTMDEIDEEIALSRRERHSRLQS